MSSTERSDDGNQDYEDCLEEQINELADLTSKEKNSKKCKDSSMKQKVISLLEQSSETMNTFGSGSNDDMNEWTRSEFLHPTLLPDFKLQPIVKLFSAPFMK